MDNYIGRLLDDRYEILDMIGSGGMAVVYKARCNRLNRLVAIKILKADLSQDAEFRRRFHAESQAVAMLSHPNIVSVYDVSHSDHLDYIVMELIDGITLKQYMEQKGCLNWREALHFATQIAKALEHAHSRGIIHRDIKPHNIMILKDGSVKVADFGIARVSSAQHTLTREALGSVHYISPEQAKGAHVDERTDLYSLGVVLYEMLTGRPPFDGDTPVSVAIQHINAKATAPRELNPTIPVGLEQITTHAMAANLDERYGSASEMLTDLEEFRRNPNCVFDFTNRAADVDIDAILNADRAADAPRVSTSRTTRAQNTASRQQSRQSSAPQEKPKSKSGRVPLIAGIVCLVVAFCAIGYFLYSYFFSDLFAKTEEDTVPNFIGQYYEAIDESAYPNFIIEISDWKQSENYDYGYVIDQNPVEGRTVKVGSKIELTVSMGVASDTMPDLVNTSLQNAQSYLSKIAVNVLIKVEYENSDVYTDGYVIRTEPEENATLTDGQTVTLYVSQGSQIKLVAVPALVGEDLEKALEAIDDAGLSRGGIRYVDSDLPEGTVTFQSIEAGEKVKLETVINLQVSKGPQEAETPYIYEQTADSAVDEGGTLRLEVKASVDDGGTLSYAWYASMTGSEDDAVLVSRSAEDNNTCMVDTSVPGIYYYFCKIVNTLGESTATTTSKLIEVVVMQIDQIRNKVITLTLPSTPGMYEVAVYVGGEQQGERYIVDTTEEWFDTIDIQVSGTGIQDVDIYLDGTLYDSQTVDFDSAW